MQGQRVKTKLMCSWFYHDVNKIHSEWSKIRCKITIVLSDSVHNLPMTVYTLYQHLVILKLPWNNNSKIMRNIQNKFHQNSN
jgi:hypothetical protein